MSGTPPTAGAFSYAIKVTDSKTPTAQTATTSAVSGTIAAAPTLTPTVTAISPSSGTTEGGTSVIITGTNFTGATAVTFGGAATTTFSVVNATTITATTPAHTTGAVDVTVTTPGGIGTGTGLFTYAAPADDVTSVSPNQGPTTGGTRVTISGAHFTGATAVAFGGIAATAVTVVNSTSITATTPVHAAGVVDVAVTTPGGIGIGAGLFTYVAPAPTVTSVNPNKGPTTGGTSVTITGTNFTGATAVKFGGADAMSFAVASATQITAKSPAGSLGVVHVTVTTAGGTSAAGAADQFTYAVPAESVNLRAMQTTVTPIIAQISSQAVTGAIDNAIDAGFSDRAPPVAPNGSGFTFNFGAEATQPDAAAANGLRDFVAAPDRRASRIDNAFSALAYNGQPTKAPAKSTAPQREWLAWLDMRGLSIRNSSVGNDMKGDQVNATSGITRKLTPDLLVGASGGYEHFDYSSDALNGRLTGDGWTVGTYLGWRFTSTMRFDLALARSGIAFNGTAGTATAAFPGSRWLASSGLTGTYRWQSLVVQPSAHVYAMWEHENGYTDSLGTVQPDRNFTSGRASAGAKLGYPFLWTPTISLAPNVGVFGDYYFSGDNASTGALASSPLLYGWSARLTTGLDINFKDSGQLSLGGDLGGIGGNTKIWTWRARGSVPF